MPDMKLIVRTADRAHKAELSLADSQTCGDIIQAALDNWTLPKDTDYAIVNVSKSPPVTLNPALSLSQSGIEAGETLEIQPVLVAGGLTGA